MFLAAEILAIPGLRFWNRAVCDSAPLRLSSKLNFGFLYLNQEQRLCHLLALRITLRKTPHPSPLKRELPKVHPSQNFRCPEVDSQGNIFIIISCRKQSAPMGLLAIPDPYYMDGWCATNQRKLMRVAATSICKGHLSKLPMGCLEKEESFEKGRHPRSQAS